MVLQLTMWLGFKYHVLGVATLYMFGVMGE